MKMMLLYVQTVFTCAHRYQYNKDVIVRIDYCTGTYDIPGRPMPIDSLISLLTGPKIQTKSGPGRPGTYKQVGNVGRLRLVTNTGNMHN